MSEHHVSQHTFEIPFYVETKATLKISRITDPQKAGRSAHHNLIQGHLPEFLCIGANANNQAMKSMSVLRYIVETSSKATVAFQPFRCKVHLTDRVTKITEPYDAIVWKTLVIEHEPAKRIP